jgi:two-component system NarL family response regulator
MAARRRVLIVDDDPLFRASLRAVLERDLDVAGEARDGIEALSLAAETGADLIVMDVSMPRLGGVDATRALLERDPALAVVVLTGTDHDHEDEALAAGARAYVRKSSELNGLAQLLLSLGELPAPRAPDRAQATDEESRPSASSP